MKTTQLVSRKIESACLSCIMIAPENILLFEVLIIPTAQGVGRTSKVHHVKIRILKEGQRIGPRGSSNLTDAYSKCSANNRRDVQKRC